MEAGRINLENGVEVETQLWSLKDTAILGHSEKRRLEVAEVQDFPKIKVDQFKSSVLLLPSTQRGDVPDPPTSPYLSYPSYKYLRGNAIFRCHMGFYFT